MHRPHVYQIRVEGRLASHWSEWFGGMVVTQTEIGETLLAGPVVDQAALHGLLAKIRDLNLELIGLQRVESDALAERERVGCPTAG
jgi:hypothetical protein